MQREAYIAHLLIICECVDLLPSFSALTLRTEHFTRQVAKLHLSLNKYNAIPRSKLRPKQLLKRSKIRRKHTQHRSFPLITTNPSREQATQPNLTQFNLPKPSDKPCPLHITHEKKDPA